MFSVDYSKLYKKTFKKLSLDDKMLVLSVVECLAKGQTLEPKYKDHKLKGNMNECRVSHKT